MYIKYYLLSSFIFFNSTFSMVPKSEQEPNYVDNLCNIFENKVLICDINKRINKSPRDITQLISEHVFDYLINARKYKNEKELIDCLDAFNGANKITNKIVKKYLIEKFNLPADSFDVFNDRTAKLFSKKFTEFKLNLINNYILSWGQDPEVRSTVVGTFEAFKWSKRKAKSDPKYQSKLNEQLTGLCDNYNNSGSLYKDDYLNDISVIIQLGADPNAIGLHKISSSPEKFSHTHLHVAIVRGNTKLVRLLIDCGASLSKKYKELPFGEEVPFVDAIKDLSSWYPHETSGDVCSVAILLLQRGAKLPTDSILENSEELIKWIKNLKWLEEKISTVDKDIEGFKKVHRPDECARLTEVYLDKKNKIKKLIKLMREKILENQKIEISNIY